MLCAICIGVLEHRRGQTIDRRLQFRHHATIESLQESARSSCQICYKAWHALKASIPSSSLRIPGRRVEIATSTPQEGSVDEEENDGDEGAFTFAQLNYRELPGNYLLKIVPNLKSLESSRHFFGLKYIGYFRLIPCAGQSSQVFRTAMYSKMVRGRINEENG